MGQGVSGGGGNNRLQLKGEKIQALVVEDVHILTKEVEVQVPKFVEKIVEVPKYVPREVIDTQITVKNETVTTQSVVVEEKVIEVTRPIFKDVIVDRPVYKDVEIEKYTVKRVDLPIEVPRVTEKVKIIEKEFEVLVPKMVEEIIKVPKIVYVPTEVERVVWKDVPRERCSHCGKPV